MNPHRMLIVNRLGAVAVIGAFAERMGIQTVASYSLADAKSPHLRRVHIACGYGGESSLPADTYANVEKNIAMAYATGSKLVHLGYGFGSEHPDTVQAFIDAGLTPISAQPHVMRRMADKISARQIAIEAGVPVVPGTTEAVSPETAVTEADRIGYPIMVKSANLGGGMGIGVAHSEHELLEAVQRVQRRADGAGIPSSVFLERFIGPNELPRHVEVQVLGDTYGNMVSFWPRDCSVQRARQKLIQETIMVMEAELVRKLRDCAERIALLVGYVGVGTVEFLVNSKGEFWFMEMNCRLQVESWATDFALGDPDFSTVQWQIRTVLGEKIPFTSADLTPKYHVVQVRIYPEIASEFAPGEFTTYQLEPVRVEDVPDLCNPNVWFESAFEVGGAAFSLPSEYNNLIGQIAVRAKTRHEAISHLVRILKGTRITPVLLNNVAALAGICLSPPFWNGTHSTHVLSDPQTWFDFVLPWSHAVTFEHLAWEAGTYETVLVEEV